MPDINEYKDEQRIFALFCATSKSGKSTAAASFPKPYHQADFDLRFAGVKGAVDQGIIDGKGISYTQFNPTRGLPALEKHLTDLENYYVIGQFPYKSYEIASLTNLARLLVLASHGLQGGKTLGGLRISGPADFNFESSGTHQVFDKLRTFPCHIIVSAHIVPKWGKSKGAPEYAPQEVIGHRLSVRDNLGENVQTYFDNVFQFSREMRDEKLHYYVEFANDLAGNTWGIPPGKFEITNKPFYPFLQDLIRKIKEGKLDEIKPKQENAALFGAK